MLALAMGIRELISASARPSEQSERFCFAGGRPNQTWDALKRSPYNRRSASPYNFAKSLGEVDGVQVAGYRNFPFEFFLDGGLKGLGCGGLAVNQVRLFWRGGEAREPAEEFALAGMCGKLP
jgi:hypothetical protein